MDSFKCMNTSSEKNTQGNCSINPPLLLPVFSVENLELCSELKQDSRL
jgi:hypothetical protein